jgi:ATP-dependent helicase/nuclease subunit A
MTRDRAKNVDSERAFRRSPSRYAATDRSEAAQRGVLMHRVLQYLDFAVAVDGAGVALELHRMVEGGVVSLDDRGAIDADALVWFVATPLADSIRQAGDAYRREFTFVARESPEYFDANVQPGEEDFVLVRGIVDGILPSASGIDIVDYKTDDVSEDEAASDDRHRAQMSLYARAMARTWRRPVGRCLLVYLSARTIVTIDPVVVRG